MNWDGKARVRLYDFNGDPITFENPLPVKTELNGHICLDNSTSDNLGVSEVFNGVWQDTLNYNFIIIGVKTDQDSAVEGLLIEWSADGVTVHDDDGPFHVLANKGKVFTYSPARRYMRITYTNGTSAQSFFNIQTIFKKNGSKGSSHKINDSIVGEDDAELVKAVLSGEDQNGVFQNARVTEVGNQMVSDFIVEVARGNVPGYFVDRKFGSIASVAAATPADVWSYGVTLGAEKYTFSTTDDIDRLSSSNANDNGLEVTISGLDVNYALVTQTVFLDAIDATTPVALTTPLIRANRAFNSNGVDFLGNIYVFVDGITIGGVPSTVTDVRAFIPIGSGQTLQAIYTVPAGFTAFFLGLEVSLTKAGGATAVGGNFTGRTRDIGKVFRTQDDFDLLSSGSSNKTYTLPAPLPFIEKTDFVATVDVTANGVGASWAFSLLLIPN